MGISQQYAEKAAEDKFSEAEKQWFMPEDSLANDESDD